MTAPPSLDYSLALCDDDPMARRPLGLTRAFKAIVDAADRAHVRIVVCGAMARNAYLRPRMTDDADLLLRSLEDVRALVTAAGADFEPDAEPDLVTRLLYKKSPAKIDLIVAEHRFELEAIDAPRAARVGSREVLVVPPESLAAMKVDAASDPTRPEDFGEVVRLVLSGAALQAGIDAIVRRDLSACVPTWEAILRAVDRARAAPPKPRGRRR